MTIDVAGTPRDIRDARGPQALLDTARLFFDVEQADMDQLGWEGTKWLDLMVETDPERDYYVRTKKRLSGFYPTDLEFLLRQLGVANVVLTIEVKDSPRSPATTALR